MLVGAVTMVVAKGLGVAVSILVAVTIAEFSFAPFAT